MLAGADVAVAVSSAADVAQAASDVVVTGELGALAEARTLAQQMLAILRQNRRWALGYNLATVPLAALGFVPPWLAAIGMSASSLAVVLNALRIGRVSAVGRRSRTRSRRDPSNPAPERVGMNSLLFLIPLSILLLVGAGIALFWAVDHGQFDDMDTPGLLPLLQCRPEPTDLAPGGASDASSNEAARPLP